MSGAFRPLTLAELHDLEIPGVDWLVEGLLPAGSLTLLSAREKAGKGLFAIDLLASIAFEEPFLGRPVRPGAVAYCAAEESIGVVYDRIVQRVGERTDGPLYVLRLDGSTDDRLKLDDLEAMTKLQNMIAAHRLSALVLDPLIELHDRPENDADEMAPLIRPVRQMAHATGCAIVVDHHDNKTTGYRGSTAILGSCDQGWALKTDDAEDGAELAGKLTVKGRYGPKTVIPIRFGAGGRWEVTNAPTLGDPGIRARILTYLREHPGWHTAAQLWQAMPEPRPLERSIQNALAGMRKEAPAPFAVAGTGEKNDPRRYHALAREMGHSFIAPSAPGMNDPNGLRNGHRDSSMTEPMTEMGHSSREGIGG